MALKLEENRREKERKRKGKKAGCRSGLRRLCGMDGTLTQ